MFDQKKLRKKRREALKRLSVKKPIKKVYAVIVIYLLLIAVAGGVVFAFGLQAQDKKLKITLEVESQTILQDEAIPPFKARAITDAKTDTELNWNTGFTVQELLDDLNSGIGYNISTDSDGTTEGAFIIHAEIDNHLQERISSEWNNRVIIETIYGELTVNNKYGYWENKKFKRYDGTYVKNDFIESRGEKYYFDAEGNMVTGEMKLGFTTYVFSEEGKMLSEVVTLDVNKPMVALTYDDGPGTRTNELLDTLEANNAHATFFMLGQRINDKNENLIKRMVDIGCEAANHSYSHAKLTKLSEDEIKEEIKRTNDKIMEKNGAEVKVVRPPYGSINDKVRASAGQPLIMWSIDTLDWKTNDAKATVDHIMNNVRDGDIILMHDIHDPTIEAAKILIPKLKAAGYQLVTVSEMAEARGVTLEPGQSYSEFWK